MKEGYPFQTLEIINKLEEVGYRLLHLCIISQVVGFLWCSTLCKLRDR